MRNNFQPLDDVADSMQAAASRLGVPLEAVKRAKRDGSDAFRGSRVHVGKLAKELTKQTEPGVAEILGAMLEQSSRIIAGENIPTRDAENLISTMQLGFGVAVLILEPAKVDGFLRRTAKQCEQTFKSIRKLSQVDPLGNNNGSKHR